MTNQSAITDYLNKQYAYAEDNFDQLGDDAKRIAAIVIASNNIYNGGYGQSHYKSGNTDKVIERRPGETFRLPRA